VAGGEARIQVGADLSTALGMTKGQSGDDRLGRGWKKYRVPEGEWVQKNQWARGKKGHHAA